MARQGRERRTERDDQRVHEQSNDDNPRHAPESGEPEEAGRTRGRVIEKHSQEGEPPTEGETIRGEIVVDESGRHGATPE